MTSYRDSIDDLDAGDPREAAWQAFRSQVASALLLDWLLSDMEHRYPEYFSELEGRFQTGFDYEDIFRREGRFDGWVPIHASDDDIDFWISIDNLRDLLARLFPHEAKDVPSFGAGRQLVVVMLYSAIENLARAYGFWNQGSTKSVVTVLDQRFQLGRKDHDLRSVLTDLRETRNLIAHNSAVVTDRYVSFVQRTQFQIGERRIVSSADIARFSRAIETVAEMVRSAS